MLPILYSFRRCPYAVRARLALHAAEIPYELREVSLKNKPTSMLLASPKATVPVLVDETTRQIIDESIDIMRWAFAQQDPLSWYPKEKSTLQFMMHWIEQNDKNFKPLLDRYKYPNRFPNECVEDIFERAKSHLDDLNRQLTMHPFLIGNQATMLDAALLPFVRQFAKVDWERFAALNYAALQKWLEDWIESDIFSTVMRKYPVWQEDEEGIIIQHQNPPI